MIVDCKVSKFFAILTNRQKKTSPRTNLAQPQNNYLVAFSIAVEDDNA